MEHRRCWPLALVGRLRFGAKRSKTKVSNAPPQIDVPLSGVIRARARVEAFEQAFQPTTLGQFLSRKANQFADATAIEMIEGGRRATYSELEDQSNRVAHALLDFGVRIGDRVVIML